MKFLWTVILIFGILAIGIFIGAIEAAKYYDTEITLNNRDHQREIEEYETKLHQDDDNIFDHIRKDNPHLSDVQIARVIDRIITTSEWLGANANDIFTLAQRETNFDENAVGPCGELGIIQVTLKTYMYYAKKYGYTQDDYYNNLEARLEIGIRHWQVVKAKHGDIELAFREYNSGSPNKSQHYGRMAMITNRSIERVRRGM